jgi:hypothetical protein
VFAEATNCFSGCSFSWTVDGVNAGTTVDVVVDATFFTAHSQLAHAFAVGSHVVTVTITDGLQRTITLELEFEVAAVDLGKPPETDTLDAGPPTNALPRLPIAGYLFSVGLLLVIAGFGAMRRSQSGTADQRRRLPE